MRRYLGVSETAQADARVKPAPPVDPEPPKEDIIPDFDDFPQYERGKLPQLNLPDELKEHMSIEMEELPDDFVLPHDEL